MSSFPDDDGSMDTFDGDLSLFGQDILVPNEGADAIRQRTMIQMEAWEGLDTPTVPDMPGASSFDGIDGCGYNPLSRSPRGVSVNANSRRPAHRRSLSRNSNFAPETNRQQSTRSSSFSLNASELSKGSLASHIENSTCTPEFLENVSAELIRYHEGITRLLVQENLLPPAAADELRTVLESIGNTVKHVKAEYEVVALKSPVLALLELTSICWNFNNEMVMQYRSAIMNLEQSRRQLEESLEQAEMPVYISTMPNIPVNSQFIRIHVKCAHLDVNNIRVVTPDTTANQLIEQLVQQYMASEEDPKNWVLKVEGLAEYIYGPETIFEFESVRVSQKKNVDLVCWQTERQETNLYLHDRIFNLGAASKEAFYERSGRPKPVELEVVTEDMEVEDINMRYLESARGARVIALPSSALTQNVSAPEHRESFVSKIPASLELPSVDASSFFGSGPPTSASDSSSDFWQLPPPPTVQPAIIEEDPQVSPAPPAVNRCDSVAAAPVSELLLKVPSLAALTPRVGYEVVMKSKGMDGMHSGRSTPTVGSMILVTPTAESDGPVFGKKFGRAPPPLPPGAATHHIDAKGKIHMLQNGVPLNMSDDNIVTPTGNMSSIEEDPATEEIAVNQKQQEGTEFVIQLTSPDQEQVNISFNNNEVSYLNEDTTLQDLPGPSLLTVDHEEDKNSARSSATSTPTAKPVQPTDNHAFEVMQMTPELHGDLPRFQRRRSIQDTMTPRTFQAVVPTISSGASHFFSPLSTSGAKPSVVEQDDAEQYDDNMENATVSSQLLSPAPAPPIVSMSPRSSISATPSSGNVTATPQIHITNPSNCDEQNKALSSAPRTSLFRYSIINSTDKTNLDESKSSKPKSKFVVNNTFIDDDSGESQTVDALPVVATTKDIVTPLCVQICGIDRISEKMLPRLDGNITHVYVAVAIVCGTQIMSESVTSTDMQERCSAPRWQDPLVFKKNLVFAQFPHLAKVVFVLVGHNSDSKKQDVALAWASQPQFDHAGLALSGPVNLGLWPVPQEGAEDVDMVQMGLGASGYVTNSVAAPKGDEKKKKKETTPQFTTKLFDFEQWSCVFKGTNRPNLMSEDAPRLTTVFDEYCMPIYFYHAPPKSFVKETLSRSKLLTKDQSKELDVLENMDILQELTPSNKSLLFLARSLLVDKPHMLTLFLRSIDWFDMTKKEDVYAYLRHWKAPTALAQIVSLLDCDIPDIHVREYAVKCLGGLSNSELQLHLLQLTQCLKFELYHDNALGRFLVERAIAAPQQFGHAFFWCLKNEIDCDPPHAERYTCMLEAFLSFCPVATDSLRSQQIVMDRLERLALSIQVKRTKSNEKDVVLYYREQIELLNRDIFSKMPGGKFPIPLDPRWEATGLIPEKCKIMSSKMAPLWLVFNNADPNGNPLYVMFKAGDDLRQDILTLQILRYMDNLWLKSGVDLRLSPYKVVATGLTEKKRGCGLIEIMLKSCTTAGIQMQYGGGAGGAFKIETLDMYLRAHNDTEDNYKKAVENFTYSCAGYCVATYVMGIGDRHNDNIMLTYDGHLFHIDFGHILGNFKFKYGFKRERSAFVFTPEMAYVIGGKNYESSANFQKFKHLCYDAFLCLRRHANELETLFQVMLSAGLPELTTTDLQYLRTQLCLEYSDAKAIDVFKQEIKKALSSTSRRVDNYFHLLKHAK